MTADINAIRRHIKAVEETKKITSAMLLVSTARAKQASARIEYNKAYFRRVRATIKDILIGSHNVSHPYLTERGGGRCVFIVVAGDKGLAGGYNSELLRFADGEVAKRGSPRIITVGIISARHYEKLGMQPDSEVGGAIQDPSLYNARILADEVFSLYDSDKIDEAYIIYSDYRNQNSVVPTMRRLLPLREEDYADVEPDEEMVSQMIYEPSAQEVFNRLVPQYTIGILYNALMQAYAGEQFSRMNAMDSASGNAEEMLKKLRIKYNIARQEAITNELTEIMGAAEALRGGEMKQ